MKYIINSSFLMTFIILLDHVNRSGLCESQVHKNPYRESASTKTDLRTY